MVKVGQNDTICVWEILKNFEVGKQNQFVSCCHKTSVGVDSKVKQKASTLKNYNQIYVELRLCLLQCSDNHPVSILSPQPLGDHDAVTKIPES